MPELEKDVSTTEVPENYMKAKKAVPFFFILVLPLFIFLPGAGKAAPTTSTKPVVIGYVAGYSGIINTEIIEAEKLTHINYAFVDIKNNQAWLHNEKTDTVNFRKLNLLKKRNPDLKILISIGGWSWSKNFSDAVLTDSSRKLFAVSAVNIIREHGLNGVDIDWEYPNMPGDGNTYRPDDKYHYTLMFEALRTELNTLGKQTGLPYLLTTAVGGFSSFVNNTEMDKVQQQLDYINLMAYDYSWGSPGHHTNLYPSKNNVKENSAHKAVSEFLAAGVPAGKLVMGLAFYSRGWVVESLENNGFNQKITSTFSGGGYTYIKDSLVNQNGFISYWDEKAKAPYLLHAVSKKLISYDDERSVKEKCNYVKKLAMGGVMFWEYSDDPKGYLLNAIYEIFRQ